MSYKVIDFGLDPNYAQLVTDTDGVTKNFPTIALAEQEKAACQDAVVVCTGLYGHAIFDEHCMLELLKQSTGMTQEEAKAKFDVYMVKYRQQYEG